MTNVFESSNSSSVAIIASCNEKYAPHLGVMFLSVLKNAADSSAIHFYLIDCGVSSANKALICEMVESFSARLHILPGREKDFDQFDAGRYGVAALQRLAMAELLPEHVKRVIYLDSDMIILGDVSQLADFDLGGSPLAAVENLSPKASVGINLPRSGYFNSGMLVVDLDYWRQNAVKEQTIKFLSDNADRALHWDQCALNAVFENQWARLPIRWNLQTDCFGVLRKYFDGSVGYTKQELIEAINSPAIIHYIGKRKPWLWDSYSPYKAFYEHYKSMSLWKKEPKPDASFRCMLKSRLALRKRYKQWRLYSNLNVSLSDLRDASVHPDSIGVADDQRLPDRKR
jgi:lipopolysaccharide biosynthesis glycosyltransferase